MSDFQLRIEYQATNPPKPTAVGVFRGHDLVAVLDIKAVRDVVKRWDEMEQTRATSGKGASE